MVVEPVVVVATLPEADTTAVRGAVEMAEDIPAPPAPPAPPVAPAEAALDKTEAAAVAEPVLVLAPAEVPAPRASVERRFS